MLIVVGGLNWGLVGLFDFNLVTTICGEETVGAVEVEETPLGEVSVEGVSTGEPSALSKIVYIVVGLAALYIIAMSIICCKCKEGFGTGSTLHHRDVNHLL
ncbi:MAG: DUF378 domain-containing protein [Planctomycetota bacterium]|jgi:uncharacterized membrane protein YuzA (DUF378 family)